jgi:hypothetical protein
VNNLATNESLSFNVLSMRDNSAWSSERPSKVRIREASSAYARLRLC